MTAQNKLLQERMAYFKTNAADQNYDSNMETNLKRQFSPVVGLHGQKQIKVTRGEKMIAHK